MCLFQPHLMADSIVVLSPLSWLKMLFCDFFWNISSSFRSTTKTSPTPSWTSSSAAPSSLRRASSTTPWIRSGTSLTGKASSGKDPISLGCGDRMLACYEQPISALPLNQVGISCIGTVCKYFCFQKWSSLPMGADTVVHLMLSLRAPCLGVITLSWFLLVWTTLRNMLHQI